MLYYFLIVVILIACVLLMLVVLVQNSKGGGLAANFQSSTQIMGVRRTADFLEKATWTLATTVVVLSIVASLSIPRNQEQKSIIEDQINQTFDPTATQSFPTSVPEDQEQNQ
jgi:preprotein translocase subunit SecG